MQLSAPARFVRMPMTFGNLRGTGCHPDSLTDRERRVQPAARLGGTIVENGDTCPVGVADNLVTVRH